MLLIGLKGAIPGGEKGVNAIAEDFIHDIHILLHEDTGYNAGLHVPVSFGPALRSLG